MCRDKAHLISKDFVLLWLHEIWEKRVPFRCADLRVGGRLVYVIKLKEDLIWKFRYPLHRRMTDSGHVARVVVGRTKNRLVINDIDFSFVCFSRNPSNVVYNVV